MTPKPASGLVFFIDRSLGRKYVAEALRTAGATVEVHDDHFPQTTPDVEWLAEVGRRGWVVLSKDERIRRNRIERGAGSRASPRLLSDSAGHYRAGNGAPFQGCSAGHDQPGHFPTRTLHHYDLPQREILTG